MEAAERGNQTKKLQDLLGEANCHRTTAGSNRAGYSSGSDCGILSKRMWMELMDPEQLAGQYPPSGFRPFLCSDLKYMMTENISGIRGWV